MHMMGWLAAVHKIPIHTMCPLLITCGSIRLLDLSDLVRSNDCFHVDVIALQKPLVHGDADEEAFKLSDCKGIWY